MHVFYAPLKTRLIHITDFSDRLIGLRDKPVFFLTEVLAFQLQNPEMILIDY